MKFIAGGLIILCLFLCAATVTRVSAEDITVTTYYPAPYGVYETMRLYPIDTINPVVGAACTNDGEMLYDGSDDRIYVCAAATWRILGESYWVLNGTSLYPQSYDTWNVGIGTATPGGRLDVVGGDMYFGSSTANTGTLRMVPDAVVSNDFWFEIYNQARTATGNKFHFSGRNAANETMTLDISNQRVGIGTSTPQNKLDVEGAVVIGATYSGSNTAPTNGLLVEGNVGIGTSSPLAKLHVQGQSRLTDTMTYAGAEDTGIHMTGRNRIWWDGGTSIKSYNDANTMQITGHYVDLYLPSGALRVMNGDFRTGGAIVYNDLNVFGTIKKSSNPVMQCDWTGYMGYADDGGGNDFAIICRNGVIEAWCHKNGGCPRGNYDTCFSCSGCP